MALTLVTNRDDAERAFAIFEQTINRTGVLIENRILGYRGGSAELPVYWMKDHKFWCYPGWGTQPHRCWIAFGIENPDQRYLTITLEMNPPHEGENRRTGGVFLTDHSGKFYIGHTGKVGGGLKGIGKRAFLPFYRGGNWVSFTRKNGVDQAIVFGPLDRPIIVGQLAHFIQEVARFKEEIRSNKDHFNGKQAENDSFDPEFSGKKSYSHSKTIEAQCNHGLIVDALYRALRGLEHEPYNNRQIDLFLKHDFQISMLFEVKTDVSTTSIYTGLGQLMIHGALQSDDAVRVLVLPERPIGKTRKALERLGIKVLTYKWDSKHTPIFTGLKALFT